MLLIYIFIFIFIFPIKLSQSFNIDTYSVIIYKDPNIASFFGYSVVLYPGNTISQPWILIGAPRGTNRNNIKSGVTYKCKIAEKCELFDIDAESKTANTNFIEKIDSAWIGSSADINYKSNRIASCAHRWIKEKRTSNGKATDYHIEGACYWFNSNETTTQKLLPLLENHDIYTDPRGGGSVYNYALGQAGFSLHMPVKSQEIILGAPGVYNWHGTTIQYKDIIPPAPVASRLLNNKRKVRDVETLPFGSKNIANAVQSREMPVYGLFGYSVSSGYFYHRSKLFYVSSAPRADYKGKVFVYRFDMSPEKPLLVHESLTGNQMGEYFGGSLTVGDINNDGLDDLIVGSPYYSSRKFNEGRIYIFLGSKSGKLQPPKREVISGEIIDGQFGKTVQYLGDINHDRYGDIAAAAPYENENSGSVYIFRGTYDGLDVNYCQKIIGKNIDPFIKGFGMSMSRAVDMDANNYADIAIGAYSSGHVVLLRSRPVITLHQEIIPLIKHLKFKTKKFQVSECYWYYLDQLDPGTISITRTLILDQLLGRAQLTDEPYEYVINLPHNKRFCRNFTVNLVNSFSNRYDPIKISISHVFNSPKNTINRVYIEKEISGTDSFCPKCPVYNKYESESSSSIEIPFALGCKSGNICEANLQLHLEILNIKEDNTYVIGSDDYLKLKIDVENIGEKAYLTQVSVTVPNIVTFSSTPSACSEKNSSSVVCSVDNPVESNTKKSVSLDLDMTNVNTGKYGNSIDFVVELLTSSENLGDKTKFIKLKLKREADLAITGESGQQSYSYKNLSETGLNFTQMYRVETFGSSPLNEITVEINIPHILKEKDANFLRLYPPIARLSGEEVICKSDFTYLRRDVDHMNQQFDYDSISVKNKERKRRDLSEIIADISSEIDQFHAFQNRTFYVNCSNEEFLCSKIICKTGPIKSGQIFKISLNMVFNIEALNDVSGLKDVILFATQGRAFVSNPEKFIQSGDKPDRADAVSFFIKKSETQSIALWIIIVSAIAGILLLILLIIVLIKIGFFKREKKEELELLKKEYKDDAFENIVEL